MYIPRISYTETSPLSTPAAPPILRNVRRRALPERRTPILHEAAAASHTPRRRKNAGSESCAPLWNDECGMMNDE